MLFIVQNRETQFDAPLYALISRYYFPLRVIYTTPIFQGHDKDDELGFAPSWDHLSSSRYSYETLSNTSFLALWRLALYIKNQKPSLVVICGYFPRTQLLLAIFLRFLGQRIGLRSDNTLAHTTFHGFTGALRRIFIGIVQRLFHSWHPVGEQASSYLHTLSGVNRPTYRFSYSVDNDWFFSRSSVERQNRESFLIQNCWPVDSFVVLGVMKWNQREDPITLVTAFKTFITRFLMHD